MSTKLTDPTVQPTRAAVLEKVRGSPGCSFVEVARAVGLAFGSAAYHLSVLERWSLIFSARDGRWRRYWPTNRGAAPAPAERVIATSRRGRLLAAIREHPGIDQTELHRVAGVGHRQNTGYHVRVLAALGIIHLERSARRMRHYPGPAPPEMRPLRCSYLLDRPVRDHNYASLARLELVSPTEVTA
ncbi:MAG: hypothetical protein HYT80_00495 [Euryarchaeota archaeon]|nr:hypothetical protein [Euryarchaeota archaeon]